MQQRVALLHCYRLCFDAPGASRHCPVTRSCQLCDVATILSYMHVDLVVITIAEGCEGVL